MVKQHFSHRDDPDSFDDVVVKTLSQAASFLAGDFCAGSTATDLTNGFLF